MKKIVLNNICFAIFIIMCIQMKTNIIYSVSDNFEKLCMTPGGNRFIYSDNPEDIFDESLKGNCVYFMSEMIDAN